MIKQLLLFILLFQLDSYLFAQNKFVLKGSIPSMPSGIITLEHTVSNEYYSIKLVKDTIQVINHNFLIKGILVWPQQIRLMISQNDLILYTEPFFINAGKQQIVIDSLRSKTDFKMSGLRIKSEGSKTDEEYRKKYLPLFYSVSNKIDLFFSNLSLCEDEKDSLQKQTCLLQMENERIELRKTRDSLLLRYAGSNPQSNILSWELFQYIWDYGYNEKYDSVYNFISANLPEQVKKVLSLQLEKDKIKCVGNYFPLTDFILDSISKKKYFSNKYMLVDFWFSGCIPCIRQFNSLRKIYNKYRSNGFEIVAISTDKQEAISVYEKVLKQNNYPWYQILDTNGEKTEILDIHKFPTSFLLDKKGNIIIIDVKPEVLDDFLSRHL